MKTINLFYYLFGSLIFIFSQTVLASSIIDDAEDIELGAKVTSCSDDHCSTYVHLGGGKLRHQSRVPLQKIVFQSISRQFLSCQDLQTGKTELFCEETNNIKCVKIVPGGDRNQCLVEALVNVNPMVRHVALANEEGEKQEQEYTQIVLSDAPSREVFCNHTSCIEVIRKSTRSVSNGVNGYEPILPYATSEYIQ